MHTHTALQQYIKELRDIFVLHQKFLEFCAPLFWRKGERLRKIEEQNRFQTDNGRNVIMIVANSHKQPDNK